MQLYNIIRKSFQLAIDKKTWGGGILLNIEGFTRR